MYSGIARVRELGNNGPMAEVRGNICLLELPSAEVSQLRSFALTAETGRSAALSTWSGRFRCRLIPIRDCLRTSPSNPAAYALLWQPKRIE
jgi:hypothetical protein